MSIHHLKIHRQPFEDLVSGRKTGEVRNCADREFREGDQVELFLIDETGNPANKSIVRTITHIQRGYGLPDDICALSYAAPVVDRQPVAWVVTDMNGDNYFAYDKQTPNDKPLYAEPPAPVAVVLPERCVSNPREGYWSGYNDGWNACLDKVKELNQ